MDYCDRCRWAVSWPARGWDKEMEVWCKVSMGAGCGVVWLFMMKRGGRVNQGQRCLVTSVGRAHESYWCKKEEKFIWSWVQSPHWVWPLPVTLLSPPPWSIIFWKGPFWLSVAQQGFQVAQGVTNLACFPRRHGATGQARKKTALGVPDDIDLCGGVCTMGTGYIGGTQMKWSGNHQEGHSFADSWLCIPCG